MEADVTYGAGSIVVKGTQLYIDPPVINKTPSDICSSFEVSVKIQDVSDLFGFDIEVSWDNTLITCVSLDKTPLDTIWPQGHYEAYWPPLTDLGWLKFVDVDYWGVLGGLSDNAGFELLAPGKVHVWDKGGLIFNSGDGLLFALTFHVEFDDRIEHIWRVGQPHTLTAWVKFEDATLSFEEGTIPMSGIIMPPQLNITVNLIKGDVDCDGDVDVFDLRTVAAFYDKSEPTKYDLTCDGTIDVFDLVVISTNFGYTHDP